MGSAPFFGGDMRRENIVLIGMPASGKSTAGVVLAKVLGMDYIDTDLVIQSREGMRLSEILEKKGLDAFIRIEGESVMSIDPHHAVIATGGSVIYHEAAMAYLKQKGVIVYMKVEKEALFRRLKNIRQRGVALGEGETLEDMYAHRAPLYEKYADIVVSEDGYTLEATVRNIVRKTGESHALKV